MKQIILITLLAIGFCQCYGQETPPFYGTRYFNFDGGSGTNLSLTITKDNKIVIKSYSAPELGSKEYVDYKGIYKSIIKTTDATYKITGNKISELDTNGNIIKQCGDDGKQPCTVAFYTTMPY